MTPRNYGTFPDLRAAEREWVCFSTALSEGWLMLECNKTGAQGVVKDPTRAEWGWAFDCPSNPKPWTDNGRVKQKFGKDMGTQAVSAMIRGLKDTIGGGKPTP